MTGDSKRSHLWSIRNLPFPTSSFSLQPASNDALWGVDCTADLTLVSNSNTWTGFANSVKRGGASVTRDCAGRSPCVDPALCSLHPGPGQVSPPLAKRVTGEHPVMQLQQGAGPCSLLLVVFLALEGPAHTNGEAVSRVLHVRRVHVVLARARAAATAPAARPSSCSLSPPAS